MQINRREMRPHAAQAWFSTRTVTAANSSHPRELDEAGFVCNIAVNKFRNVEDLKKRFCVEKSRIDIVG